MKSNRSAGLVIHDAINLVINPEQFYVNMKQRFDLDIIDEEFKNLLQKY